MQPLHQHTVQGHRAAFRNSPRAARTGSHTLTVDNSGGCQGPSQACPLGNKGWACSAITDGTLLDTVGCQEECSQ